LTISPMAIIITRFGPHFSKASPGWAPSLARPREPPVPASAGPRKRPGGVPEDAPVVASVRAARSASTPQVLPASRPRTLSAARAWAAFKAMTLPCRAGGGRTCHPASRASPAGAARQAPYAPGDAVACTSTAQARFSLVPVRSLGGGDARGQRRRSGRARVGVALAHEARPRGSHAWKRPKAMPGIRNSPLLPPGVASLRPAPTPLSEPLPPPKPRASPSRTRGGPSVRERRRCYRL
jgi:hypothetical protein